MYDLSRPRRIPYSVKICVEEVDELRRKAESIIETVDAEGREPSAAETFLFDKCCEQIKNWKREERLARQYAASKLQMSQFRLGEVLRAE